MRKLAAIIGSTVFFVIAPGFVAGLVPWWISHWRRNPAFSGFLFFRNAGAVLIAFGIIALLDCFARFAFQGGGTPAPVFPTQHLVVTGLYRYVRNPMYVAGVSAIIGQALVLGNMALLAYAAFVWLASHVFVLLYEEPKLRATFGAEYQRYCSEVPRWIPRFTSGNGSKSEKN